MRRFLAIALVALLAPFGDAGAGTVQEEAINKALEATGVKDEDLRAKAAKAIDAAVTAAREYATSMPKSIRHHAVSAPKGAPILPIDQILTIAVNLPTLGCAKIILQINLARREFFSRPFNKFTKADYDLYDKLTEMEAAIMRACEPILQTASAAPKDKAKPEHFTGAAPKVSEPFYPADWTDADIDCFKRCMPRHKAYVSRAQRTFGLVEKRLKFAENDVQEAAANYARVYSRRLQAGQMGLSCEALGPLEMAQALLAKRYDEAIEQVEGLNSQYLVQVVNCIKTCSVRVQLHLNSKFPETPRHVYYRELFLTNEGRIEIETSNRCG